MPNPNFCSNRDTFNPSEYDVSLDYQPSLKNDEKLCKYSYSSWCPVCDRNSPRRRSKSETNEPCKRKSKEMKSLSVKKYPRSHEYENMESGYEANFGWFETKEIRCDSLRVRSNLCELPTSYIANTNNCQSQSVLSNSSRMSSGKSDFVDSLEKSIKSYDQTIKLVELNHSEPLGGNEQLEKPNLPQLEDRFQKNIVKYEGIHPHYNGILKYEVKYEDYKKPRKSRGSNQFNLKTTPNKKVDFESSEKQLEAKTNMLGENAISDIRNVNEKDKYIPNFRNIYTVVDPKFNISYNSSSLNYDTGTYFNTHRDNENLRSLYTKEVEYLRVKLKELKKSAYSRTKTQSLPGTTAENGEVVDTQKVIEEVINAQKSMKSPLSSRTKSKLITVKTKTRLGSTSKLRKSGTKILTHQNTESECIESDYSDSDESLKDSSSEEEVHVLETSNDGDTKIGFSTKAIECAAASGDYSKWPVRESLFPNVPPYIFFSSHELNSPKRFPIGRKLFQWKLSTITPVLVRKTVVNSGFAMVRKSNQWMGTWGKHIKSPMFRSLKDAQKLNHFPGTFHLGRKDRLWKNFQKLMSKFGTKEFGFIPHTYIIPQELKQLKYNWDPSGVNSEWWIIKPPASARGVGIKVINKWSQLPKKQSLVVQKYINQPYLINGSKFDLRLYVLLTSFHPLRIYLYEEGLVRFASVKYSNKAKDIKEKYMHLTNYSINKMSSQYAPNEDANACKGHKWTITKLMEYLHKQGVDTETLWSNLEKLVIKTIIACEPPITGLCKENINLRYNCFELFGVDVLLDHKLKPWLLEVNISPSLHSNSPLDECVKGPMVQTMFNIAQYHFPVKLSTVAKPCPPTFEPKLYTTHLTSKEVCKHNRCIFQENRGDYLESVLENLTGDDVRHLIQAEDELRVKGRFQRVFPTADTFKYLEFMEPRYYNRLFDAWETKYEKNRDAGIRRLQILCNDRVHLKVPSNNHIQKSGLCMNLGEQRTMTPISKESHPLKEVIPDPAPCEKSNANQLITPKKYEPNPSFP